MQVIERGRPPPLARIVMQIIARHEMLVAGDTFESCRKQVVDFFTRTELVRYDRVTIDDQGSLPGSHQDFGRCVAKAIRKNRQILEELADDLKDAGVQTTADLLILPQGYPSKVLHILTHFLDGFIGTDSVLYNLIDDSHWLPEQTRQAISAAPDGYWLIPVDCFSETPERAALIHH
jgi:hypothetical protein